ncbi:ZapG family protein [Shewanella sp. UCD-KL12]|uniref:ZapG family protein n=1 Tax=Shewanella sp. UCD-KL12 TaxID=1917163 RepID=UPI0009707FF2|nr:DUF1043 family protein [Shewanella sp. UCD-KL12]
MGWPLVFATFILGIVLGYVGRTVISRNQDASHKGKALEQTKLELSQHKQEVTDHFEVHHKQLTEVTEQLSKMNKQWNDAASTLAPKSKVKPLATLNASDTDTEVTPSIAIDTLESESVIIVDQKN